jgi:fatty-acyl-CoA synthase
MQGLMMNYPLTLDRILEHANRVYPTKRISTKQIDGSMHRYTYADLYKRVKRLANVLIDLGINPGDRVATFAWNNYQHMELYYAIPGMGAICHTLNIRLFPDQLAYVINHAEDKVIFIDGTLLPLLERVADKLESVQHYVLFNTPPGVETKLPNALVYEELMAAADEDFEWHRADENDAVGLCYTSGTTGDPKGVLYSHRSTYLHALGESHPNALNLSSRDIVLPVVPQFHVMAWGLPYACPLAGAELVMPGPHLKPAPLAQLIDEEKVTIPAGVPSIWNALYQELQANPRDISHVRALTVGGSAMPRSLIEAYERMGVNVLHAWGMTEMSPVGTASMLQAHHDGLPDHEKWDIKAKQGYVIPGVELRITNEQGEELPWDGATMGEVQVRGPWITRQYYKVEPTPESFTADGWFRTGDVATISDDGYMELTDRTKDLVKSGGEWISSVALENALMAHPKVMEAAVIATPDEKWDERPLAAVVLTPDAGEISPDELQEFLAPKFAKFWLPDHYVFVQEIPKTSVGKFDKKVLRHRHEVGQLG